jgi:type I restriction enzyme R subunit
MESERQTRKRRIDPKLKASHWNIARHEEAKPLSWYADTGIEEFPTNNGPADYGLCVDGHLLGIVEAKKLTLGPQNVLTQAERYSRGATANPLNFDGFRVPFLYSTNGEVIWFHDVRHPLNRSRRVTRFDFHVENYLGFVHLGCIKILLRCYLTRVRDKRTQKTRAGRCNCSVTRMFNDGFFSR